jgi:hypothetical protein
MFDNATFKKAYQEDVQTLTKNPLTALFSKWGILALKIMFLIGNK